MVNEKEKPLPGTTIAWLVPFFAAMNMAMFTWGRREAWSLSTTRPAGVKNATV
jgi:hypothetical protein